MEHKIKLHLNTNVVGHKDISVEVSGGGKKLGTVLISKGNIEWLPSPKSKKKHRMTWEAFADMMTEAKVAKPKPKKRPAVKKVVRGTASAKRAA